MSDNQMFELYERLVKGKKPRPSHEQMFLRGWNAGIDFAIDAMRQACDEPNPDEPEPRPPVPSENR